MVYGAFIFRKSGGHVLISRSGTRAARGFAYVTAIRLRVECVTTSTAGDGLQFSSFWKRFLDLKLFVRWLYALMRFA